LVTAVGENPDRTPIAEMAWILLNFSQPKAIFYSNRKEVFENKIISTERLGNRVLENQLRMEGGRK
jgi:hypothetical protein